MDNRSTGEFAGDHPDFHRNSYCAAPSWPPDESIAHNSENHRRNFSGDVHHHHQRRQQHQQQSDHHYNHSDHRHHQNSNLEPNDSVDGAATGNFGHSMPLSGRKRPFTHSQPPPLSGIHSCNYSHTLHALHFTFNRLICSMINWNSHFQFHIFISV